VGGDEKIAIGAGYFYYAIGQRFKILHNFERSASLTRLRIFVTSYETLILLTASDIYNKLKLNTKISSIFPFCFKKVSCMQNVI